VRARRRHLQAAVRRIPHDQPLLNDAAARSGRGRSVAGVACSAASGPALHFQVVKEGRTFGQLMIGCDRPSNGPSAFPSAVLGVVDGVLGFSLNLLLGGLVSRCLRARRSRWSIETAASWRAI
jgi:hypothetical protein